MDIKKEDEQKIQELQSLENSFQNILMQKQAFQVELNETSTALEEIGKTNDSVYRVLGQIMLKADKNSVKKELEEKKNLLNLRMKSIEKQELSLRETIERLRADIVDKIEQ